MPSKSPTKIEEIRLAKPYSEDESQTSLVGRFGSFILTSEEPFDPPHAETLEAISDSLEKDSRVTDVAQPEHIEDAWCIRRRIFPAPAEDEGLVSGLDALQALHFSDSLTLSVTVPKKNQPLRSDDDDVPTEYTVVWNGMFALVTWRTSESKHLPLSGGHIVVSILRDALKQLGLRLYVQGCNPGCTHEFAHTDIRFVPDDTDPDDIEYMPSANWGEVRATTPIMPDKALAEYAFLDIVGTAREFTILKNLGRRILEAEQDGRARLSALMKINYARARLPTLSPVERLKAHWAAKGWLRRSRFLIAHIWLTLSNLELLRREWTAVRFGFEEGANERGKRLLFERDYADEVDRVESLDLELMRSGVQEMAERLDSRALLRVTAVAAVAGAIAGGVVGGVIGAG